MRDDIHKRVPRPPKVQRWVQLALREADRLSGRSLEALEDAARHTARTEISGSFLRGLGQLMENNPSDLFGALGGIQSPREIGGRGSDMERRILGDCQRAALSSTPPQDAIVQAIADALRDSSHADIRAAEPVLLPTRDPEARRAIDQMKLDARVLDYHALAEECAGVRTREPRRPASISPEENLLAPQNREGGR